MHRLVTGWYPSKNTAERICKKIKSIYPYAQFYAEKVGCSDLLYYVVQIDKYMLYADAEIEMKRARHKGIFCGIEAVQNILI